MHARHMHPGSLLALLLAGTGIGCAATLAPWQAGMLDIHQISTGRGNAALVVCPDGTGILIDAGASDTDQKYSCEPRPDASRRPGEWIGRYVRRHLEHTGRVELDYLVATHLHPDHVGDIGPATPRSERGDYHLTGVADVAELVPVATVIDRGFPDYSYPTHPVPTGFARNYLAFVNARRKAGASCEKLRPGAADQVVLRRSPGAYPNFEVRNIAANGQVWTGKGNAADSDVPSLQELVPADYPDENMCSIALRLSYGKFDWFSGGDLTNATAEGTQPWRDIETPAACAAGPVDVAVANHHGYFDALGAAAIRLLRPRVWIVPAWHVTHPGIAQLERMLSERLYPGRRDIFLTDLLPATALLNQRFLSRVSGAVGHIVVRVEPGGGRFRVFVTDNGDESDRVIAEFGPFDAR